MSDNSSDEHATPVVKPKKKRNITEEHRAKLVANVSKARAIRVSKTKERKEGKNEDELIMKEIIAEKKKAKIFGIEDDEPAPPVQASKIQKEKMIKDVESSESEQSEPASESDVSESEEEEESASSSESSDDEAEFVLKRKKAAPKAAKVVKAVKAPVKKEKKEKKAEKVAKESIMAEMARMTAEIAALKKVNVYVNQPEKKDMSDKQRRELLDL